MYWRERDMKDLIFSIQQYFKEKFVLLRIVLVLVGVVFCVRVQASAASPYGAGAASSSSYGATPPSSSGSPYGAAKPAEATPIATSSYSPSTASSSPYASQSPAAKAAPKAVVAAAQAPAPEAGSYLKKAKAKEAPPVDAYAVPASEYKAPARRKKTEAALHPSMVTSQTRVKRERSALGLDSFGSDFSLRADKSDLSIASPDISRLLQDSESAIRKLEDELNQKEQQLEDLAKKKLEHLQTKVEQEINAMRQNAEKMAVDMRSDIKEEALKLRHDAAHRTLGIISRTEEEALELKRKKRLESLNKRFGATEQPSRRRGQARRRSSVSRYSSARPIARSNRFSFIAEERKPVAARSDIGSGERVSPEWKNDVSRQFYSDMSYMKQVILQGESRHEIHDFNKRFSEQNGWFDKTLRAVRYVNDQNYVKVLKKQRRLHDVIAGQKLADAHLKKVIKGASLSLRERRKVRLMVLYDLNSTMQQREAESGGRLLGTLDIDDITGIVKKTVEEFSVKFKERSGRFPDVKILDNKTTQIVPVMAQKLQEELEEVQTKLEQAEGKIKSERAKRKQLRADARQKIQEKAKDHVALELKLRRAKQTAEHAGQVREKAMRLAEISDDAKHALAKRLEQSEKEGMIFELEMKKAQQKVALAREEAVRETQGEFAELLEEKEKKNLELSSLLQRVTDKATFFREKATELVGQNNLAEEKASLADKRAEEASALAHRHASMQKEAEAKANASKQLADKTVSSINKYLKEQKKSLTKVKADLTKAQEVLKQDQALVSRERDELLAHKNLLSKEQGILEELKKETRSLVESSMRINDESLIDLLKLRQSTEYDLKKMQQDMSKELSFVRDELNRIKVQGGMRKHAPVKQKLLSVKKKTVASMAKKMPARSTMKKKKPLAMNSMLVSKDLEDDDSMPGMPGVDLEMKALDSDEMAMGDDE